MIRAGYEDDAHRDPYEETYDPEPYPISPHAAHQQPTENYYPNSNYFPPPPGSTPNLNATPQPYNPADYPPPPGAAPPPQPYNYGAGNSGPETYAPRPRRADENVSAPLSPTTTLPTEHAHDGAFTATPSGAVPKDPRLTVPTPGLNIDPNAQHSQSIPRSENPSSSPLKFVAFDLNTNTDSKRPHDPGYETDDSDSTIDEYTPGHRAKSYMNSHSRARSSSVPSTHHDHHSHARAGADASSGSSAFRHQHPSHSHSHHSQRSHPPESSDSSESTIELPDRFDSKGRLLPTRENPSVESLGSYIRNLRRVFV